MAARAESAPNPAQPARLGVLRRAGCVRRNRFSVLDQRRPKRHAAPATLGRLAGVGLGLGSSQASLPWTAVATVEEALCASVTVTF